MDSKIELDFERSCRENEDYRYVEMVMLGDVEAQNYLVEKKNPDGNPEQLIIGKKDFEYLENIIERSLSKLEKKFLYYI
ncbi:hypothetical protein [Peptostreptococcus sp. D1]|uniref:hypothetical protein n=1 Tax=Peptostreptococcus sp. D1 TaxID=72304 RepID=UPI0008E7A3A0|nr:hypothetical protein [Peptostreptococcus sp. D1]SFE69548.1 hypothetical protein SAMN02910278_01487 [Peptostreptococcus sp. D1]